jgi:hypothetical protein
VVTRNRLAVALLAGCSLLSACSSHPGAAAVVGPESISHTRLDDLALALCSAQTQAAQTPAQIPGRSARQGALGVLVNAALSRQFGESQGVTADQAQVSAAIAANQSTLDKLPASRRAAFSDALRDFAEGQTVVIAAGRKALVRQGAAKVTDDKALAEGNKLRAAWLSRSHVKVSVDPRFGTYRGGTLAATSGSLSVPVSSSAKAGAAAQPAASWTSSLPATQTCD